MQLTTFLFISTTFVLVTAKIIFPTNTAELAALSSLFLEGSSQASILEFELTAFTATATDDAVYTSVVTSIWSEFTILLYSLDSKVDAIESEYSTSGLGNASTVDTTATATFTSSVTSTDTSGDVSEKPAILTAVGSSISNGEVITSTSEAMPSSSLSLNAGGSGCVTSSTTMASSSLVSTGGGTALQTASIGAAALFGGAVVLAANLLNVLSKQHGKVMPR